MMHWFKRRKQDTNLINATHLIDWVHNELVGTDDPAVEQAYYAVIERVEKMRVWARD